MSYDIYWRFFGALALVVALIFAVAWIARRLGVGGRHIVRSGKRRLAIVEILPLDGKRRLLLLRRDGIEHLVLLGLNDDVLIEGGIPAASDDFATALEGTRP